MRVLVTGATGFTGSHLARTLAAAGHTVRLLVRQRPRGAPDSAIVPDFTRPAANAGAAALPDSAFEIAHGDLRDDDAVAKAVEGAEVVYNIAALYRQAGLPRETYHAVNARAVGHLVERAARAGVRRVVHCSTVGVHGDIKNPPATEDTPLSPGDVYQETKVDGEAHARDAGARFGIEVTIVRPSGIYGPGDRRLLKLFRNTLKRFPILGSGRIYYHLTYIDDLVQGFRLCGEHPAAGRTYILAGGEVTTLNELVNLIAEVGGVRPQQVRIPAWPFWLAGALCEGLCTPLGVEPPIYRRRVDFFTKSRAFDITRARVELGYTPAVGLRDGVTRTLAWYREHGWI